MGQRLRTAGKFALFVLAAAAVTAVIIKNESEVKSVLCNGTECVKKRAQGYIDSLHGSVLDLLGKTATTRKLLAGKKSNKKLHQLTLVSRTPVTHDSFVYKFEFVASGDDEDVHGEAKDMVLGLPIGNHVKILADIVDKTDLVRPYTPISTADQKGTVDFLIKSYPDGLMSNYLKSLPLGGVIKISGPYGLISYISDSTFEIGDQTMRFDEILFIAGGTGITPCYSVINAVLNSADSLKMSLLFANKGTDDILMYDTLKSLSKEHEDRFKYYNTVDNVPEDKTWSEGIGYVNKEMIEEFFPMDSKSKSQAVMICGPPQMVRHICTELEKIKFPAQNIFKF